MPRSASENYRASRVLIDLGPSPARYAHPNPRIPASNPSSNY
jgi:hypothetical protein